MRLYEESETASRNIDFVNIIFSWVKLRSFFCCVEHQAAGFLMFMGRQCNADHVEQSRKGRFPAANCLGSEMALGGREEA